MNKNIKTILCAAILAVSSAVNAQAPAAPAVPAPAVPAAQAPAVPVEPAVAAPAAVPVEPAAAVPEAPAAVPAAPVVTPPVVQAPAAPIAVPVEPVVAAPEAVPVPASAPAGMFGIVVKFDGSLPTLGLAYATATTKTALNFGFNRTDYDESGKKADQKITIGPSFACDLGRAILPYGIGIVGELVFDSKNDNELEWAVTPNFYTKAWLVDKVVSFGASMGPRVSMNAAKDLSIGLGTSGMLTFYFM